LSRLTFEFAQNTWEPDFIFGLVPEVIAQKGIGVRYGYFHGEPGLWKTNDDRVLAEEWVVWMGKEDIRNLTNREVPKPRMIPRKPSYDHALTKPNGIHYSAMIEEAAL
jgi:hypothetical protein